MNDTVRVTSENKIVPYLKFAIIAGLVAFLYYPEIQSTIQSWSSGYQYSHGYLIPLISGYLIWRKRDVLQTSPITPDYKGIFIFLAGISLLLIGYASFEPSIRRYSLIITIIGLIYFLLGKSLFKILLFPVGYLILMIPIPYILFKSSAVHLRTINIKAAYFISESLGIPIIQDGATLFLPNATLQVIDWCTGIQSIIAMTAISTLYVYLTRMTLISKIILVLFSIPLAIIGNIFRIVVNILLAYFFGEHVLKGIIHNFQGMINFSFTLFLLVIVSIIIKKIEIKLSAKKV